MRRQPNDISPHSEIAAHTDFSGNRFGGIRYAQCWEDADVLLRALDIGPQHVCLSVASAGDNTLAMLGRGPQRVVALDLSAAQIACLELRVAAYRTLEHGELLHLIGSRGAAISRTARSDVIRSDEGAWRLALYGRCRAELSPEAREFWNAHRAEIAGGIGGAGRFERYFGLFRRIVLPLIHPPRRVGRLLGGGARAGNADDADDADDAHTHSAHARSTGAQREKFFDTRWNSLRWRLLFRVFCSRAVLGRLGRDPQFFRYAQGDVPAHIMARIRHVLTALDPAENPYLTWILTGRHRNALPHALRAENFEAIRNNLHRLEWRRQSLEEYLSEAGADTIDRFNGSDVFEYMSPAHYENTLRLLLRASRQGGRLAYWNMLAPRRRPESLAAQLRPMHELAAQLHAQDKVPFYSDFVIEEIIA